MATNTDTEGRTVVHLIHVGRQLDRDGKLTTWWRRPEDEPGRYRAWKSKDMNKRAVIGGIYGIEVPADEPDGGTVYPSTLFWTGRTIDDPEQVAKWRLQHEADTARHQAQQAERKAISDGTSIDDLTVRELREWIRDGGHLHRTARIAVALKHLDV